MHPEEKIVNVAENQKKRYIKILRDEDRKKGKEAVVSIGSKSVGLLVNDIIDKYYPSKEVRKKSYILTYFLKVKNWENETPVWILISNYLAGALGQDHAGTQFIMRLLNEIELRLRRLENG